MNQPTKQSVDLRWCNIYKSQPDGFSKTHTEKSTYAPSGEVEHDLMEKAHLVERSNDGPHRTLCGAFASGDVTDEQNDAVCPICTNRAVDMGWL